MTCRRAAWMAGWFSCPESPGFHPGLFGTHEKALAGALMVRVVQLCVRIDVRATATKSPRRRYCWCVCSSLAFGLTHARPTQKAPGGSRGTPGRIAIPRAMRVDVARQGRGVFEHGWRGGVRARSPRVSTRGFLGRTEKPPAGVLMVRVVQLCVRIDARATATKSPRREPGDSGSDRDPTCHACGRCPARARGF